MAWKLLTVEDSFTIFGRGIVLLPGPKILEHEKIKTGDKIMLRKPDGIIDFHRIGGFEFPYPNPNNEILILGIKKEDIPIGTEVWTID